MGFFWLDGGRFRAMLVATFLVQGVLSSAFAVTVAAATADAAESRDAATPGGPSGEAGTPTLADDETLLAERVSERWDAMIARDLEKAYGFMSPAYRQLYPLEHLQRLTGTSVTWIEMDIDSISVDQNRAEVKVSLKYKLSLPPSAGFGAGDEFGVLSKQIEEVWVWKDEEWWYVNPHKFRL